MATNQTKRKGSYAPLSANYYKDDAIAEAGEAAELLYVRGLAFCADMLNDGFISDVQLARFPGVGMADVVQRAETLVEHGLWRRDERRRGYVVRSWLTWNKSRKQIEEALASDRSRKAKQSPSSDSGG